MTDVQERVGMPLDEFIRLSNDENFELINGERIPRLPTVTRHNETIYRLLMLLGMAAEAQSLGIVRPEATYILPDHFDGDWVTGSRIPDLLFIAATRLAEYKESHPDWQDTPYQIVPDLVVEVISPTDKFSQVYEKVDAYLSDGVRMIVLVDPQRRTAEIHEPDAGQPLHLSGAATLDLGDVIPGFQVALPKLFE